MRNNKNQYRFSLGKMFISIFHSILSSEWITSIVLFIFCLLLLALWMDFSQKYLANQPITSVIDGFVLALFLFTMGYYGYLGVKFRSFPSKGNITGKPAIMLGLVMMVFSWSFAIYSLYLAIFKLINMI
jgi:hypothetical protein